MSGFWECLTFENVWLLRISDFWEFLVVRLGVCVPAFFMYITGLVCMSVWVLGGGVGWEGGWCGYVRERERERERERARARVCVCVYIRACMHTHTYSYIHTYIHACMHKSINAYTNAYTYTHTHTHIHTHTHTHTHKHMPQNDTAFCGII